ncbi:MAG: DsbA family protein [Nitrososphaera sp.]|nr:DsbA family protein [Nitrososphaera sp.]
MLIPVAIGVGVIIVASVISLGAFSSTDLTSQNNDHTSAGPGATQSSLSVASLIQEGAYVKGDADAPVTLIEFADFQCPFCGRFARQTAPVIDEEYIDTGKVNMVFKHFPLRGADSISASIASQCAGEQGKFWDYHDTLYENQGQENSGWASKIRLKGFAADMSLDTASFDSCLDSNRYSQLVQNDLQLARDLKLTGTPTFLIAYNDGSEPQALVGAQPADAFRKVLNDKLADI